MASFFCVKRIKCWPIRGSCCGKFNLLLKDENFVNLITFIYPDIIKKYSDLEDPKLKWELIKMEIRRLTICYAKNKARKSREIENELTKRLDILDEKVDSGECTTDAEQKEHEYLKTELHSIHEKRG